MENEQFNAIGGYLESGAYQDGYKKLKKIILRRSCKSYKLVDRKLYYKDQKSNGKEHDRLVLKRNEADRVFLDCHLTAGGYRERDATVGKIKEQYYWPNLYKEIEEKVLKEYMKFIADKVSQSTLSPIKGGSLLIRPIEHFNWHSVLK